MSYIAATDLHVRFADQVILEGATLAVQEQDRIGLIGPNGSGKSTLLKILHGDITPDDGQVTRAKRLRIGYLPQDITELPTGKLLEFVLASVPGRTEVEARLADIETALDTEEDVEEQMALSQTLADIHEELAHFEEQFSPHEAMRILQGLGFTEADHTRSLAEFSGGWKMRAALAGLLFQQPDVLLLDEPTNHLDIPSVHWLESFFKQYRHAMILISHDRTFLNRQVNRIVSFEVEGLRSYTGDYDAYVRQREEEIRVLENQAKNQEQKRKQMQQYISRFRVSARRSSQAQSRLKALDKMDTIVLPRHRRSLSFRFPPVGRAGEVPLRMTNVHKAFGENVLYRDLSLHALRGDRIGVIGVNGAGKTTLLRLLAGELAPDGGQITRGHAVSLGYYAQHHTDILSPGNTVLYEVLYAAQGVSEQQARNMLGLFMFSGDTVQKTISVLSGGEKARVALARLMVQSHNVLLMDEPTNHLDLDSSEALAEALGTFDGTLIFVSHNQAFVNALATKMWDIGGGVLTEYPGNLDEYFDHRSQREQARVSREAQQAVARVPAGEPPAARGAGDRKVRGRKRGDGTPAPDPAAERRALQKRLRPLRRELEDLERRIADLEARQAEREHKLGRQEVFENQVLFQSLLKEFEDARQELERLLARWEGKQADVDQLERALQALES